MAFAMALAFALVLYRCGLKFDYSMTFGLSSSAAHLRAVDTGVYECFARTLASRAQRAATRAREAMARCTRLLTRTARASFLGALPCIMVLCLLRRGFGAAQGWARTSGCYVAQVGLAGGDVGGSTAGVDLALAGMGSSSGGTNASAPNFMRGVSSDDGTDMSALCASANISSGVGHALVCTASAACAPARGERQRWL